MDAFDWEIYCVFNKDLYESNIRTREKALQHYRNHGIHEDRVLRFPLFDMIKYSFLMGVNFPSRLDAVKHYHDNGFHNISNIIVLNVIYPANLNKWIERMKIDNAMIFLIGDVITDKYHRITDISSIDVLNYENMLHLNVDDNDDKLCLCRTKFRTYYSIEMLKKYNYVAYDHNNYWKKKKDDPNLLDLIRMDNDNLLKKNKIKFLGIYFPQFHRIPENDRFWGNGFTEWTLLKKTNSIFKKTKHPHNTIGYYNMLDYKTRDIQENIAKKYHLHGFMYYHYWFNGKPVMHRGLQKVLEENKPNMEYCFSWANESWTKRWDGLANEILLKQGYGEMKEWKEHYYFLSKFFKSANYILIDNKPLFLIYRVGDIKHIDKMKNYWNQLAQADGFDGIIICPTYNSFDDSNQFIDRTNWEYRMKFYPMSLRNLDQKRQMISKKHMIGYDYDDTWNKIIKDSDNYNDIFLSGFSDWSNHPRRKGDNEKTAPSIFSGSTPQKFQFYLIEHLKKYIFYNMREKYYFINAWNEWNEQATLEPDNINGYKYLEALKNAYEYFD